MLKSINKVTKTLMLGDFFLNSAWGFVSPFFAIFIVENITKGNPAKAAEVAGFATLTYWATKSCLQIPIGNYLDKNHGEKDTFWFIFLGMLIMGFTPFGYLLSKFPWQIYLSQIIYAVGAAMYVPAFYSGFTKFIDKGKEAFEWGLDSTSLGFGIGITGALGGVIYSVFDYRFIFVLAAAINLVSAFLILLVKKEIYEKKSL